MLKHQESLDSGLLPLGKELEFNSEYKTDKWGFTAKEQSEGMDGKLLRGSWLNIKGGGFGTWLNVSRVEGLCYTDLTGFIIKIGRSRSRPRPRMRPRGINGLEET